MNCLTFFKLSQNCDLLSDLWTNFSHGSRVVLYFSFEPSHPSDCSSHQTQRPDRCCQMFPVLTLRIFFSFLTWSTCFNLITSWIARIFSALYSLVFLSRQRQTRAKVPEILITFKLVKTARCFSKYRNWIFFLWKTWMVPLCLLSLSPNLFIFIYEKWNPLGFCQKCQK